MSAASTIVIRKTRNDSLGACTIYGQLRIRMKDHVGHLHGTAEGEITKWEPNEWRHVVVTWDDDRVKLYLDDRRRVTVVKGQPTEAKTTSEFRAKWSRPWTRLTSHVGAYQLPPQLPEAYTADAHLVLLGDSTTSRAVAALQASDLLPQVVDAAYPGPGKALVSFAWSPFAVEKNVILVGAADAKGLAAGVAKLVQLAP